jgi:hypothetical protein
MAQPNGYVFYRGPSEIDGRPILAVAVGFRDSSSNVKTGAMLQTYILPAGIAPHHAIKTGEDVSVCGGCVHRPLVARKVQADPCYVTVFQGPRVVWEAASRGVYPDVTPSEFGELVTGRLLRLGSWGEPVAVPLAVWQPALASCAGHTGYTHRWRTKKAAPWRGILQASCDNPEDYRDARAAEWGTFRVALPSDPVQLGNEFHCPASKEAGKALTCAECLACDGTAQVVILSHGPKFRKAG